MKNSDYTVVLADPSPIILQGLSSILLGIRDYQVVLKTTDLHTVAGRLHVLNPDLLIVNPMMIDFAKRFMVRDFFSDFPTMKVIALVSTYCDGQVLKQYHGVIEINDDAQGVKSILSRVIKMGNLTPEDNESALSDREKEVLVLLAQGSTNKNIAQKLHLSVNTVNTHRKNIIRKTGIKSVAALTVYAILNNLIEQKDII